MDKFDFKTPVSVETEITAEDGTEVHVDAIWGSGGVAIDVHAIWGSGGVALPAVQVEILGQDTIELFDAIG